MYSRIFREPAPNGVLETHKSHTQKQLIPRRLQYISMIILTSLYVKTRQSLAVDFMADILFSQN